MASEADIQAGVYYQKCGVMLMDIFGYSKDDEKADRLMKALDSLNLKYGRGTIKAASEGIDQAWRMNRVYKSPNYLGDWKEIPRVS